MLVLLKNYLNYLKDSIYLWNIIMMECLSLVEDNIMKDLRNVFRQEKETKAIKNRILRDINNFLSMKKKKNIINQ